MDETLWRTLRGVPTDPAAFAQTLSGANPRFDYSAGANPDGTTVYAIPASPVPLSLFIPSGAAARITVSQRASGDPLACDFEVALDPATPSGPQAVWHEVPRQGSAFVSAVYAGTDPAQKLVLDLVRIMNPGHTTLADGEASSPTDVVPFLSIFNAINDGVISALPKFNCTAVKYQKSSVALAQGSRIIAATLPLTPTNGYPAFVDWGGQPLVTATMLKPGKDGGWLNEPPRNAVRIRQDGLLRGDAATEDAKALAPTTDLTVEAWAMIRESLPGNELFYPRIMQNVIAKSQSVDRYMLGLAMTATLQFLRASAVCTDDTQVPDGSEAMRLFPADDFTVQFYIRPDLSTPTDRNTLYVEQAPNQATPIERLSANKDGSLEYTIETAGGWGPSQISVDGYVDTY